MTPTQHRIEEQPTNSQRWSQQAGVPLKVLRIDRGRLALRAGDDGLELRWPQRASAELVEHFLERQRAWIERQQLRYAQIDRRLAEMRRWQPGAGAALLLFGALRRIDWNAARGSFALAGDSLQLGFPDGPGEAARRALAGGALALLQRDLLAYARELQARTGLKARSLTLKPMRSLWGSCSIDGRIRMNSALVFVEPEVARYVLAHELAHLDHRDHSPRFWARVEQLMPDYPVRRRVLQQDHAVILRLGEWLFARVG